MTTASSSADIDANGWIEFPDDGKVATAALNLQRFRNEFSPFCDLDDLNVQPGERLLVDSYYGQAYEPWSTSPRGIYGRSKDLPSYSGDELANVGFLRVPFRRIPRRLVHSRRELEELFHSIRSADPSFHLLLRGQTRERLLERDSATLQLLYDDPGALEPQLLPSAVRHGVDVEALMPQWCQLLQLFIATHEDSMKAWAAEETLAQVAESLRRTIGTYKFSAFALALAQHYGLPSVGLDATDRLEIALFFALTKFKRSGHYSVTRQREGSEPAVIYFLSPRDRFQMDYNDFRLQGFPATRPDVQRARFLHTGWGLNRNDCARHLFLAVYLDSGGDFGRLPTAAELFPPPAEDKFGRFLGEVSTRALPEPIMAFIRYFSWVK